MIVNEGGEEGGRLIRILQSLRRGIQENSIVTSNILGPPPPPLGDKQQPVVHWCFEDPECLLSLQS